MFKNPPQDMLKIYWKKVIFKCLSNLSIKHEHHTYGKLGNRESSRRFRVKR